MASTNPFLTPLIDQVVPNALSLKDKLTHGAAIASSRYNALFTPITGQGGYGAGGLGTKLMTFKLTSSDYLDASTLNLSWQVAPDVASANYIAEESILSVVQQVTVRVGGVQLYTITDFPAVYNALVSLSMPKAVYDQDGPAQGLYKSSDRLWFGSSQTGYAVANGFFDDSRHAGARAAASSWFQKPGGQFYSIPLGFLFSGLEQYFPLRNVSNIEIEFLLQSSIGACVTPATPVTIANSSFPPGAAPATPPTVLNINEAELRCDMVRCSPDYYALMDREILQGSGVTVKMDMHTHIPFSLNASSGAPAERALQTAQSVRFLKTVMLITRPTSSLNSLSCSKSAFGNHQFAQFRVLINGMSYPQIPISKCWDAFNEAKKSQNKLGKLAGDAVAGTVEWLGPYQAQAVAAVAPSRDGTWWGSAAQDDSRFILSTNLETFLTSRDADLDGINLAESAGSLCEVRITNAPSYAQWPNTTTPAAQATNPTYGVILHHTGVLSIRGGAVEFLK